MNIPHEISNDGDRTRPATYNLPPAPGSGSAGVAATGLLVLAALGGAVWLGHRQLGTFLSTLDEEALSHAARTFDRLLDRQREQLAAEVTVLADDNRIRATVLAPTFDEATVQDVIDDLRKVSGATLLAVLDANGKAQAVSGTAALRQADLGASPAVKAAFARASSDVWTLPDQVQLIGLAPVRSGDQSPALLVKGLPLDKSQLTAIESTLGVAGAVFIGEKIVATTATTPDLEEAFRTASRLSAGIERITTARGSFVVRVTRTGPAATAARVAWLIPFRHHVAGVHTLVLLTWAPLVLGALLFILLITNVRRTNGGNP
jgi:hypothetical protein